MGERPHRRHAGDQPIHNDSAVMRFTAHQRLRPALPMRTFDILVADLTNCCHTFQSDQTHFSTGQPEVGVIAFLAIN